METEFRVHGMYRWYVLFVLTLCYTLSFVDAKLPFILIQGIKADLHLSDTQLGLITGPAFSLIYAVTALPIARISDTRSRKIVIGTAVAVWSAFTSAGGLAGNALEMLLSRTGVAIGEAACTPAAHSMIADYFEPRLRGRALAVYLTGTTLGSTIALVAGGLIAQYLSWRIAMFAVGAIGVVAALLMIFTVREPRRHRAANGQNGQPTGLRELLGDGVVLHTLVGGTLVCVALGSATAWTPAYVIRYYHLNIAVVGASLGLVTGILGIAGTLIGGALSDRLNRIRSGGGYQLLAAALVISTAFRVASFYPFGYALFLALSSASTLLVLFYSAPSYATAQAQANAHSRSRVSALLVFGFNGVGIALGAFLTGYFSDLLAPAFGGNALRISMLLVTSTTLLAAGSYHAGARALRSKALTAANDAQSKLLSRGPFPS